MRLTESKTFRALCLMMMESAVISMMMRYMGPSTA